MAACRRCGTCRSAIHRISSPHLASAPHRQAAKSAGTERGCVTTIEQARGPLAAGSGEPVDLSGDQARAERVAAARRRHRQWVNLAIRLVSLAIALTLWEGPAWNVDPVLFTSPTKLAAAAYRLVL